MLVRDGYDLLGEYKLERILTEKKKQIPDKAAVFQRHIDLIRKERTQHNKLAKKYISSLLENR